MFSILETEFDLEDDDCAAVAENGVVLWWMCFEGFFVFGRVSV